MSSRIPSALLLLLVLVTAIVTTNALPVGPSAVGSPAAPVVRSGKSIKCVSVKKFYHLPRLYRQLFKLLRDVKSMTRSPHHFRLFYRPRLTFCVEAEFVEYVSIVMVHGTPEPKWQSSWRPSFSV